MPRNKRFEGDMTAIGSVRTPPFACLPDSHALFNNRHKRFELLRRTSPVADYIGFLSMLAKAQHETVQRFASLLPGAPISKNAGLYGVPPLDRLTIAGLPVFQDMTDDFFARVKQAELNKPSEYALADIKADRAKRTACVENLVNGFVVAEDMAQHVFIMAALQVLMTLAAGSLEEKALKPLEKNLCPACGGTHSATIIVGWNEAEGTRFCSCLYCGTMWHYVRIKCTFCEATGGIEYREIEGGPGSILAETCKHCGKYCKQVDHQKDISMDVFADDIGSIALDLLMRDNGLFSRGAFNSFMVGY